MNFVQTRNLTAMAVKIATKRVDGMMMQNMNEKIDIKRGKNEQRMGVKMRSILKTKNAVREMMTVIEKAERIINVNLEIITKAGRSTMRKHIQKWMEVNEVDRIIIRAVEMKDHLVWEAGTSIRMKEAEVREEWGKIKRTEQNEERRATPVMEKGRTAVGSGMNIRKVEPTDHLEVKIDQEMIKINMIELNKIKEIEEKKRNAVKKGLRGVSVREQMNREISAGVNDIGAEVEFVGDFSNRNGSRLMSL